MRSFVVPLALLFLAFGVPSNAQKSTVEEVESEVMVAAGAPLRIECRLRVEQAVEWSVLRDGDGEGEGGRGRVASDLRAASETAAGGAVLAVLAAPRARPAHAGTYRCTRGPAPPHHAVRVTVLPAPHPPGEGSTTASPASPVNVASTDDNEIVVPFQVGKQNAFQLNCTPTDEAIPGKFTYVWKVNDTEVEAVARLKDRFELLEDGAKFKIKGRAHEDDFGNYTCSIGGPVARAWRVVGMPIAKLPANLNVVEGQKLKMTCRVIGKPYPPVEWTYLGAEAEGNGTGALAALGERGEVRDSAAGVPGGELVISAAARADAGVYRCTPVGARADDFAETTVRVKGMYDALWPFLGICAEVFLLCAIILVYEKRRTKPELDDSDTDNHDQKKS